MHKRYIFQKLVWHIENMPIGVVHRVLAEAWHETGELRAWLAQEGAWLEGLQRRLRRDRAAPADAEEIAHDLSVSSTRRPSYAKYLLAINSFVSSSDC